MHAEKTIRDLEDDVKELEAENKRLKEELKNYKKNCYELAVSIYTIDWANPTNILFHFGI